MTIARRSLPLVVMLTVAALGLGACGESDEEQIRSAARDFVQAMKDKDAERACELLGPRGEAQFVALLGTFAGLTKCAELVEQSEGDEEEPELSERDIASAKVAIRGDLATLTGKGDDEPMGLRKIDGEWRIDNIINPSLDEPERGDARLAEGTDEQQIRATARAATEAFSRRDYKRACQLMSYVAEAQILLASAFASFGDDSTGSESVPSCAAALRKVITLAEDDGPNALADGLPSSAEIKRARVTISDSHATIAVRGESPESLVRTDGRWLLDGDIEEPLTAAEYKRCWQAAGARIATRADELRFAKAGDARHLAASSHRISAKGANWRIFYTLPKGGDDPGLDKVLAEPGRVAVVAYVKDASGHQGVVEKARACGD